MSLTDSLEIHAWSCPALICIENEISWYNGSKMNLTNEVAFGRGRGGRSRGCKIETFVKMKKDIIM